MQIEKTITGESAEQLDEQMVSLLGSTLPEHPGMFVEGVSVIRFSWDGKKRDVQLTLSPQPTEITEAVPQEPSTIDPKAE